MKHFFSPVLLLFTSQLNFACNSGSLVDYKGQEMFLKKSLDFKWLDLLKSAAGCAMTCVDVTPQRVPTAAGGFIPDLSHLFRVWFSDGLFWGAGFKLSLGWIKSCSAQIHQEFCEGNLQGGAAFFNGTGDSVCQALQGVTFLQSWGFLCSAATVASLFPAGSCVPEPCW